MINQAISILTGLIMSVSMTGCSYNSMKNDNEEKNVSQIQDVSIDDENILEGETLENIQITVNNINFTVTMENTQAAQDFISMLPITLEMKELNGNEKYCYISNSFPTATFKPNQIQEGDLMLYGSNCIVLFYDDFSTSYEYTALGKIDNPEGLKEAVGTGSVEINFKKE